jgi:hypothetical protein
MATRVLFEHFTIGNARATVWAGRNGRGPLNLTVELSCVGDPAHGDSESRHSFSLNDLPDMERVILRAQLWVAEVGSVLLHGRKEKGLLRTQRETSPK